MNSLSLLDVLHAILRVKVNRGKVGNADGGHCFTACVLHAIHVVNCVLTGNLLMHSASDHMLRPRSDTFPPTFIDGAASMLEH